MSGLTLTRRGRLVRTVVLLALIVGAVALVVTLAHLAPAMAPAHITDAQWRDAVADHAAQIAR